MEGSGFYQWKDGRKYRGQYREDKKDGYGMYSWKDGRKYEGNWVGGKQHGLGKYMVPQDELMKYGLWEEGKRIQWFEGTQIDEIVQGRFNYHDYFKKP